MQHTITSLFFGLLLVTAYHSNAMKNPDAAQQDNKTFVLKSLKQKVHISALETKPVFVNILLEVPQSAQTEAAQDEHCESCRPALVAQLNAVLALYAQRVKQTNGIDLANVNNPTKITFAPYIKTLLIHHGWTNICKFTESFSGTMELQFLYTYDADITTLKPDVLRVRVHGVSSETSIIKNIEDLLYEYPHKDSLKINPKTLPVIKKVCEHMALDRDLAIKGGRDTKELPDPRKFINELHFDDLLKIVPHYLSKK